MTAALKKKDKEHLKVNEEKWGKATVEVGWTFLPNMLLERQAVLGISPTQLNILLIILKHWWEKDKLPFPKMTTIAKTMGMSRSSVQKNIRELEQGGFIRRIFRRGKDGGNTSNEYDFSGLVEHLSAFAKAELAIKEEEIAKKEGRLTIKGHKPDLKIVEK